MGCTVSLVQAAEQLLPGSRVAWAPDGSLVLCRASDGRIQALDSRSLAACSGA